MVAHSPSVRTSVYVINLAASVDRRIAFEAHARASDHRVDWAYYPARTELPGDLSYDPGDAVMAKGRALNPAELGVYASHYTLWQRFLEEGADQLLVLEDDVTVDWAFVAELNGCDLSAIGLRYLKLFNKNITPYRVVSDQFLRRTLIDCRGFAHGAQAYMVTREGARTFLRSCRTVCRPIDDEMDRSWAHGVPNIAVFPFPAYERHGPSTIGLTRYQPHALPLVMRVSRLRMRLQEKLRRGRQHLWGYGHGRALKAVDEGHP